MNKSKTQTQGSYLPSIRTSVPSKTTNKVSFSPSKSMSASSTTSEGSSQQQQVTYPPNQGNFQQQQNTYPPIQGNVPPPPAIVPQQVFQPHLGLPLRRNRDTPQILCCIGCLFFMLLIAFSIPFLVLGYVADKAVDKSDKFNREFWDKD